MSFFFFRDPYALSGFGGVNIGSTSALRRVDSCLLFVTLCEGDQGASRHPIKYVDPLILRVLSDN